MSASNNAVNVIDKLLDGFDSHPNNQHKDESKTAEKPENSSNEATNGLATQQNISAATGYDKAQQSVYVVSEELPKDTPIVKGPDFNKSRSIDYILNAFRGTGFQASNLAFAVDRINEMIHWRMSEEDAKKPEHADMTQQEVKDARCTIFLGFTSNQVSSGNREVIRYLCEHNMIDCIVTTCGAIEEDIMKCYNPHYMGKFGLKGKDLRLKGQNRIGNLIVPNKNYCKFEDFLTPILFKMLEEQRANKDIVWTPSKLIRRIGKEINNKESVWYWCYKNDIPVFCPAITDGAVGDILYFMSYKDDGFILDIARDIRLINDVSLNAIKSGMIILGGGVIKHHICNANLMRNGADYSVFINTGQEFDGSDSGAKPDEAISWGKIKLDAKPVKVYGDATVFWPFVVSGTFAHPDHHKAAIKPKRKLNECYLIDELK